MLFYGQFVGVIKAVEPPPQQNTQIPSYAVVGADFKSYYNKNLKSFMH
jgi:hypothetical protein